MPVQRAVEELRDVLDEGLVVLAGAEGEEHEQVDVARAEQDREAGRGERAAGRPRGGPGDAVGDACQVGRRVVGRDAAERPGASGPVKSGEVSRPPATDALPPRRPGPAVAVPRPRPFPRV